MKFQKVGRTSNPPHPKPVWFAIFFCGITFLSQALFIAFFKQTQLPVYRPDFV